ncbi:nucleotidyltransferase family protein [Paenarthrobacter sp. NPDC056912]|uniref:nucleotidyltransferase family protein n=1 Tax=Paenarthrobacter sp. NPDC056912 TaxID=3345965 RepID=UPI00366AA99F
MVQREPEQFQELAVPVSPTHVQASTPEQVLSINESIHLSAALVSHIAEESNIRVLLIKGPAATLVGARLQRPSCDLDVLVDRPGMTLLLNELERKGWEPRIHRVSEAFPDHSKTLLHPRWPSDIDVHWRFPGFYADESTVFELLWQSRQSVELGGRPAWTLSSNDALLVTLLHALRGPASGVLEGDIAFCREKICISPKEHFDRASELGALGPLSPVFASIPETSVLDFREPPLDWVLRTTAQRSATLRLFHLIEIPWHRKPAALLHALFPSRDSIGWHDLRLRHTNIWQQFPHRVHRLWRSLSDSLQILKEVREIRSRIQK